MTQLYHDKIALFIPLKKLTRFFVLYWANWRFGFKFFRRMTICNLTHPSHHRNCGRLKTIHSMWPTETSLSTTWRGHSVLTYLPGVDIRWAQKRSRHRRKTSVFATWEFNRRRCRHYIARIIYHRKKCNSCRGTKAGTTFMGTCHKQVLSVSDRGINMNCCRSRRTISLYAVRDFFCSGVLYRRFCEKVGHVIHDGHLRAQVVNQPGHHTCTD